MSIVRCVSYNDDMLVAAVLHDMVADLIDNTLSITTADPHFAIMYMAEKERPLPILTMELPSLQTEAQALLDEYQERRLQEALRHG